MVLIRSLQGQRPQIKNRPFIYLRALHDINFIYRTLWLNGDWEEYWRERREKAT
jgi:hypothetical protein